MSDRGAGCQPALWILARILTAIVLALSGAVLVIVLDFSTMDCIRLSTVVVRLSTITMDD